MYSLISIEFKITIIKFTNTKTGIYFKIIRYSPKTNLFYKII